MEHSRRNSIGQRLAATAHVSSYLGKEPQVLLHRQSVPQYVVLGTQPQTPPHALDVVVDVVAVDQSCPARWRNEACGQCIHPCQSDTG